MKVWQKCDRCDEEFERLYMVPYLNSQFINTIMCRNCSMEFHKIIKIFTKDFSDNKDEEK